MTWHVALLRGVNVGGRRPVAMSDLRDLLSRLGFRDVGTLLQSGNLLFRVAGRTAADLEVQLESEARSRLGLETDFIVRTAAELKAITLHNPFPAQAESDPGHLVAVFLKRTPERGAVEVLRRAIQGREVVALRGRELFVHYVDGAGRSKLTLPVIEKALGSRGTGRNWNTVRKLDAATA